MNKGKPFRCNIHKNILTQEFLEAECQLFPQAYQAAEPMAQMCAKLAKENHSPLIMLPFDYMAEAEGYGAQVIGYEDSFGLRAGGKHLAGVQDLAGLEDLQFDRGRLQEIIRAVSLVREMGLTPCLNVTGFFSLLENLIPIERVFVAWRQRKEPLLNFLDRYAASLREYIRLGAAAGVQLISYSDPMASLEMLGAKNGKGIADELLLPFLRSLQDLPYNLLIHICGLSSDIISLSEAARWQEIPMTSSADYREIVMDLASSRQGVSFLGYGCLHHPRQTNTVTALEL